MSDSIPDESPSGPERMRAESDSVPHQVHFIVASPSRSHLQDLACI